jgi:hypothetical protein
MPAPYRHIVAAVDVVTSAGRCVNGPCPSSFAAAAAVRIFIVMVVDARDRPVELVASVLRIGDR